MTPGGLPFPTTEPRVQQAARVEELDRRLRQLEAANTPHDLMVAKMTKPSSPQAIPATSTLTRVQFDTVELNIGGMADEANDRVNISVPGLYHVYFATGASNNGVVTYRTANIQYWDASAGAAVALDIASADAAGRHKLICADWVALNQGDYVFSEALVQTGGGSYNLQDPHPRLVVSRLGPIRSDDL